MPKATSGGSSNQWEPVEAVEEPVEAPTEQMDTDIQEEVQEAVSEPEKVGDIPEFVFPEAP